MNVWLVTPAWRRYAITEFVLAQRADLRDVLAARGITCQTVVVADDDNLDIADSHGFPTVEMGNDRLGAKVNAGFRYALEQGADWAAFIGSDDWLHQDLFAPLTTQPRTSVLAGHQFAVVDMNAGELTVLGVRGRYGVPPWFLPRWVLEQVGGKPAEDDRRRALELSIQKGVEPFGLEWVFHDPHPLARVDFKTDVNMTPYKAVAGSLGVATIADPWADLGRWYPQHLVDQAAACCGQTVAA